MNAQQVAEILANLEALKIQNSELKNAFIQQEKLNNDLLKDISALRQASHIIPEEKILTEVKTNYTSANDIQLDAFKSIPVFDGERANYQLWRDESTRLIAEIEQFNTHPKYATALTIVKSKVQGSAATLLTNHKVIFNFEAIKARLDYTYANQEPLHILEDKLKCLKQGKSTLSEFHDKVNCALNQILSKINMSGRTKSAIEYKTTEVNEAATRTFIAGITDPFIQGSLYNAHHLVLESAFAAARRIEHDATNQGLKILTSNRINPESSKRQDFHERRPNIQSNAPHNNQNYQNFQRNSNQQRLFNNQGRNNCNDGSNNPFRRDNHPMEVGNRANAVATHHSPQNQRPNYNHQTQQSQQEKRDREPSGSFQNQKQQRVNNSRYDDNYSVRAETDMVNNNLRQDSLN